MSTLTKRIFTVLALSLAAVPVAAGCNSILGNEHGELFAVEAGMTTFDATTDVEVADTNPPPPDAEVPDASDAEAGPVGCGAGKKTCFGQCVSTLDPLYGCDAVSCAACALGRASATCAGGACAVGTCDPGYFDCNKMPADGCEADLSQTGHCGTCNAVCDGTPTPYCSPNGSGFACSTNCTAAAPTLCGAQCVDLNTSQAHCGACGTPCPTVANGQETCVTHACQLACNPSFHICGGACASNADPATCGSACTPCVPPANATSTCGVAGVCGYVCKSGFHDCGGVCVSNTDPATCGAACTPCVPPTNATSTCSGTCGFTCNATFHVCAGACASNTDPATCGASCTPCVTPSNATATCTAGVCGSGCNPGFHDCAGVCVSNGSTASCGTTSCVACPAANATASCDGTSCAFACSVNYDDCDLVAANACEAPLLNDPLNCGMCGHSCMGKGCTAGVCDP